MNLKSFGCGGKRQLKYCKSKALLNAYLDTFLPYGEILPYLVCKGMLNEMGTEQKRSYRDGKGMGRKHTNSRVRENNAKVVIDDLHSRIVECPNEGIESGGGQHEMKPPSSKRERTAADTREAHSVETCTKNGGQCAARSYWMHGSTKVCTRVVIASSGPYSDSHACQLYIDLALL
ncbi:hypothetical protein C8F04DRAFT_1202643 [Mycena alexandri]|uniref:Uncharacterized protein n=1 Tax=Mycena alexandri TaxID=1745969 RepID=A0AAD6RVZ1_9AGAR|nr:hypothetical protein C8F04DRAFT_1202643 [Mycena alexandri]